MGKKRSSTPHLWFEYHSENVTIHNFLKQCRGPGLKMTEIDVSQIAIMLHKKLTEKLFLWK